MKSEEKAAPQARRFEPPQLWDDEAFRERLTALAERKGMTAKEAMQAIGLTPAYVYRAADARSTNLLMLVAEYFKVSPAWLAGWTPNPSLPPKKPRRDDSSDPANGHSQQPSEEASHLIEKLAEIFSEQTLKMLFITLAVTRPDVDPKALAELASIDWEALIGKKPGKAG